MPIHEYQCEKCSYVFEKVTMCMDDVEEITDCPRCKEIGKKGNGKKVVSIGTFVVNGYNSHNGYAGVMR